MSLNVRRQAERPRGRPGALSITLLSCRSTEGQPVVRGTACTAGAAPAVVRLAVDGLTIGELVTTSPPGVGVTGGVGVAANVFVTVTVLPVSATTVTGPLDVTDTRLVMPAVVSVASHDAPATTSNDADDVSP